MYGAKFLLSAAVIAVCASTAAASTISVIAGGITRNPTQNGGAAGPYDTTINDRDGSGDADDNHNVPAFTRTFSLTSTEGVTFDYDLTFTAGGGILHNFNSPTNAYGVDNGGGDDNNALDEGPNPESITFSVDNIVQTGGLPATITFDGFTGVGIFFAQGDDDAGAITDGTQDLWSFAGMLGTNPANANAATPLGVKVLGNSTDDSLFEWYGARTHTHAQVILTDSLPQTMVYEVRASPTDGQNRNRLNNVGVQFTVDVVPEPSALVLVAAAAAGLVTRRR